MPVLGIFFAIVAVVLIYLVVLYNRFIRFENRADEAWADIDVQLKRRYDLIPNLVETVRGYASHEKETFENVTNARVRAVQAEVSGDPKEVGKAENMLAGTLKSLFAVAENYPDLKASDNFKELQRELADTENKIQASRRFYNTTIRDLNTALEVFPGNVVASLFRFKEREFFEIEEAEERAPVAVDFSSDNES